MKKAKNILTAAILFLLSIPCFSQTPKCESNGVRLITVTNPAAINRVRSALVNAKARENNELIQRSNQIKSQEEKNQDQIICLDFKKLQTLSTKTETQIPGLTATKPAVAIVYSDSKLTKPAQYIKSLEISEKSSIVPEEQHKTALLEAKK